MPRKSDKLDTEISNAWHKLASGVQVGILDIPAIFDDIRTGHASGIPVADGVAAAIVKYRKN